MLAVPVERYLAGRGPEELYVEDATSDPVVLGGEDDNAWILFLFTSPRGMRVAVALRDTVVTLAPDGTISSAFPPRTSESLIDLVLSLRTCRHGNGAAPAHALVQSLLAERDADLRLVGLQLAGSSLRHEPQPWADAAETGGAHALAALVDEQPLVRSAARALLPAVPPAVALRRLEVLLATVQRPEVCAELLAAAVALLDTAIGPAEPAEGTLTTVAAVRARLAQRVASELERDASTVSAALSGPDAARRELGARWVAALVADGEDLPTLAPEDAGARLESWLAAQRSLPAGLSQR